MAGETLRSWLAPRGRSWASWGSATSLAFAPGRLGPRSTCVFTQRATRRKTPHLVGHPGELQLLVLVEAQMRGANVMKTIFGNAVSFPTMRAGVAATASPRKVHGFPFVVGSVSTHVPNPPRSRSALVITLQQR